MKKLIMLMIGVFLFSGCAPLLSKKECYYRCELLRPIPEIPMDCRSVCLISE